jgi:hypothetical protein
MSGSVMVAIFVLIFIVVAAIAYMFGAGQRGIDLPGGPMVPDDELVACTMDAKICPDGSAVGRIAPNCEFAPCPGEVEIAPVE